MTVFLGKIQSLISQRISPFLPAQVLAIWCRPDGLKYHSKKRSKQLRVWTLSCRMLNCRIISHMPKWEMRNAICFVTKGKCHININSHSKAIDQLQGCLLKSETQPSIQPIPFCFLHRKNHLLSPLITSIYFNLPLL